MATMPKCLTCSKEMRNRYSRDGTPQSSHSLSTTDSDYFFCCLNCAALYGIALARKFCVKQKEEPERLSLKEEDRQRWERAADRNKAMGWGMLPREGQVKSSFSIPRVDTAQRIVFLRDECRPGFVSVTNDAENVAKSLQGQFPGYRIVYRDSDGSWDELVHEAGAFKSFRPCPQRKAEWGGL